MKYFIPDIPTTLRPSDIQIILFHFFSHIFQWNENLQWEKNHFQRKGKLIANTWSVETIKKRLQCHLILNNSRNKNEKSSDICEKRQNALHLIIQDTKKANVVYLNSYVKKPEIMSILAIFPCEILILVPSFSLFAVELYFCCYEWPYGGGGGVFAHTLYINLYAYIIFTCYVLRMYVLSRVFNVLVVVVPLIFLLHISFNSQNVCAQNGERSSCYDRRSVYIYFFLNKNVICARLTTRRMGEKENLN